MMRIQKKNDRDPKQVVLYVRVSTEEQAKSGLSIGEQERELREHCRLNALHVERVYTDAGHSATTDRRPAFEAMMQDVLSCHSRVAQVLVTHPSRFMRDAMLAEMYRRQLSKAGIGLLAIQQPSAEGPIGELLDTLMDGISQFESRTIGVRARAGMSASAKAGNYPHAIAPYGFRIEKHEYQGKLRNRLTVCPEEAEHVRYIVTLYLSESGAQSIAARLNGQGIKRREGRWNRDSVLKVISDSAIAGTAYWGKRSGKGRTENSPTDWIAIPVEPIIERSVFEKIQECRAQRDPVKNPGRASSSPMLLGAGAATCGSCGSSLQLQTSGKLRPDGSRYEYYACSRARREGRSACKFKPIAAQKLEEEVLAELSRQALSEKRTRKILERLCWGPMRDGREREVAKVRRRIESLETSRERLIAAIAAGSLDADDVSERLTRLKSEVDEQRIRLNDIRAALPPRVISRALVKRATRRFRKQLRSRPDLKRAYVRRCIKAVHVVGGVLETVVPEPKEAL